MKNFKTILKFLLFLSLGALFIWLSLKNLTSEQRSEILKSFRMADYWWFIPAFIIGMLSHIFRALRWRMLLEPLGYYPRLLNVTYAVLIGYFANLALPRLGEVTRCGSLTKYEKISFTKSFGTVLTERTLDMVTFIILLFVTLLFQFNKINQYYYDKIYSPFIQKYSGINLTGFIIISFITGAALLVLIFIICRKKIVNSAIYKKALEFVINFWHGIKSISIIKKPFLFILYSLLIWACYFLSTWVCFQCFSFSSGLGMGAALVILVFGAIGVMVTPGGIGAFTFIVAGVMINIYKMDVPSANAFGWVVWSAQTITIIILGTIAFLTMSFINKNYIPKQIVEEPATLNFKL